MVKKRVLQVLGICLLIFFGILLLSMFYRCPLYAVSGIPCPGCGMTRAFLSLLRLDFAAAWNWNPAVYLLLVCTGYAVVCCLMGRYEQAKSFRFWGVAACLILLIWFVRFPGFLQENDYLMIRAGSIGERLLKGFIRG